MSKQDPISDSHTIELGKYWIKVATYRSGKIVIEPLSKQGTVYEAGLLPLELYSKDPEWQKRVADAVEEMKRKLGLISKIESEADLSLDFLRQRTPKASE